MKKINLFGAMLSIIIIACLGSNPVFATSSEEKETSPNNNSLTESITAPEIPFSSQKLDPQDPASYWTKEKMKNAIPADEIKTDENDSTPKDFTPPSLGEPTNISDPISPQETNTNFKLANANVPSTAGKMFYSSGGLNYSCSAAAINSPYKNLVMTAGHCVHQGNGGNWHSNMAFVPAYYNGSTPYGIWTWKQARTFVSWMNNRNYDYDQAFFSVFPKDGRNLINTVGGNGLSTGYGTNQPNVRIWGWPAQDPYDGEYPYYCEGPTSRSGSDASMRCRMNEGASGGPWLRTIVDEDLGHVFAVTSRRSSSGTPTLYATPNSSSVGDMYDQMKE
ncbi:hypothetical protein P4261_26735 [Bacillus thuringiensis]|nr:hypothetical protein [Bacillus thuringiensis]MED2812243.1 hypothetical protein [Bacillus thuringiensis]MED2830278.1 hypothetical protein [Bacillus thuringiensis]MED2834032.1 hypothetical protein [Bacillus thuringiensis]MED2848850.1 hypothetical protein [Bacillus thuringiensis]